jgi:hypothetical protein
VQEEFFWPPERIPSYEQKTYAGLANGYREALRTGTAALVGPGEVDGIPVLWIKVESKWLPDVEDDRLHEWAQEVAVARGTYEPVAKRETRDGKPGPQTGARILRMEMLPAGEGDFEAPPPHTPLEGGALMCCGPGEDISLSDAESVLGRRPVWLGREFRALPLARVSRTTYGFRPRQAEEWQTMHGVTLVYGRLLGSGQPDLASAFVRVEEVPRLHPAFRPASIVPAEGKAFLSGDSAFLRAGGVYVSIQAPSEDVALAAARALRPLPTG